MTILVFWSVGSYEIERHTLDDVSDEEAFDILWHKRDELDARFYDIEYDGYDRHMLNGSEFEQDYNDELLDGGKWVKVLHIDEEYVKQIMEE